MLQPKLVRVEAIFPLTLRLYYETREVKLFDVTPYATGSWFGELKDEKPILSRFACYQVEWGSSGIMDKIYRLMSYTKEVFPLNWSLNDINAGYT